MRSRAPRDTMSSMPPPPIPAPPPLPWPMPVLPLGEPAVRSPMGVGSFAASLLALPMLVGSLLVQLCRRYREPNPGAVLLYIATAAICLAAIVLGIVAVSQRGRRKALGVTGIVFGGVFLVLCGLVYLVGDWMLAIAASP